MSAIEFDATQAGSDRPPGEEGDAVELGTIIGEYTVQERLGAGAFGAVYRAHHPVLGRDVAIKILHRSVSSNQDIVGRFLAEARAVNQIRHRNIIDIFGFGQLPDGRHYYVMECLEGEPLDRLLERTGSMAPQEAIPILHAIARALDAAHAQGIVHRDLKAENVFLARSGGETYPKLLDFGIAKLISSDEQGTSRTRSGIQVGTPYAMAPEQCRGVAIDGRADVYALGVLAHRMMTGSLPFDGETAMDVIMKHMTAKPPTMSSVVRDLPSALDKPVLKMLAKDPSDRFARASEAVDALAEVAERVCVGFMLEARSPGTSQATGIPSRARATMRSALLAAEPIRRSRASYALGILAVVVAGVASWRAGASHEETSAKLEAPAAAVGQPEPSVAPAPSPNPIQAPALPATYLVQVAVTPATAKIFLDGEAAGEGEARFEIARDRTIRLEARDSGFKTRSEELAVHEAMRIEWALEPAPARPSAAPVAKPRRERPREVHSDLVNPLE
jgi:eukaryotic-like serine/threonine-protein kinase